MLQLEDDTILLFWGQPGTLGLTADLHSVKKKREMEYLD